MLADPLFFRDLAYVFAAAVAGGVIARLARQPLILGYVLGGIAIGPFTPGPTVQDVRVFEVLAEVGVILLMYSIGLEFSLRDLLRVRWVAILGGPLGMLLSVALSVATGALLGWPVRQSLVVGMVVSVASTMVLARLLMDRGELGTRHGRIMIGITLVEDLAVVVLTILMPALGDMSAAGLMALGSALGTAALILVPFVYLAAKVVPPILTRIARMQSQELFLLVAITIGLGTAALTQAVGLSLALGAFLAGLIVNNSDYAHETMARLLSLRNAFVALFFVTIGALIDPAMILGHLSLLGAMIGLIVVGNSLIWILVVWLFGFPLATAVMVGVGLTQIGEFSFILVKTAREAGHVGDDVYGATLAASLITILLNAALVHYVPTWIVSARLARARRGEPWTVPGRPAAVGARGGLRLRPGRQRRRRGAADFWHSLRGDRARSGRGGRSARARYSVSLRRRGLRRAPSASRRRSSQARGRRPPRDRLSEAYRPGRQGSQRPGARSWPGPIAGRKPRHLREYGASEVIEPELEAGATLVRHALQAVQVPVSGPVSISSGSAPRWEWPASIRPPTSCRECRK